MIVKTIFIFSNPQIVFLTFDISLSARRLRNNGPFS